MATSAAVIAARMIAIRMYSFGPGCRPACARARTSGTGSSTCVSAMLALAPRPRVPGRDQVNDGEDHDPDDVHEVPVEPHELDGHRAVLRDPTRERQREQREQHQHADRDVR